MKQNFYVLGLMLFAGTIFSAENQQENQQTQKKEENNYIKNRVEQLLKPIEIQDENTKFFVQKNERLTRTQFDMSNSKIIHNAFNEFRVNQTKNTANITGLANAIFGKENAEVVLQGLTHENKKNIAYAIFANKKAINSYFSEQESNLNNLSNKFEEFVKKLKEDNKENLFRALATNSLVSDYIKRQKSSDTIANILKDSVPEDERMNTMIQTWFTWGEQLLNYFNKKDEKEKSKHFEEFFSSFGQKRAEVEENFLSQLAKKGSDQAKKIRNENLSFHQHHGIGIACWTVVCCVGWCNREYILSALAGLARIFPWFASTEGLAPELAS